MVRVKESLSSASVVALLSRCKVLIENGELDGVKP